MHKSKMASRSTTGCCVHWTWRHETCSTVIGIPSICCMKITNSTYYAYLDLFAVVILPGVAYIKNRLFKDFLVASVSNPTNNDTPPSVWAFLIRAWNALFPTKQSMFLKVKSRHFTTPQSLNLQGCSLSGCSTACFAFLAICNFDV